MFTTSTLYFGILSGIAIIIGAIFIFTKIRNSLNDRAKKPVTFREEDGVMKGYWVAEDGTEEYDPDLHLEE